MFKEALKDIAEANIGYVVGLIIIALVSGVQAVINLILPMFSGICCGFIAALYLEYLETKKDNDKDK